ncbi:MAG: 3-oxoacyl-ACP reductase FabG [Candidatus Omnitrophica bacterium]|nr:3-oxoacyl-ACP reductase FabG [Candidatus Omnitrophota bacterium]
MKTAQEPQINLNGRKKLEGKVAIISGGSRGIGDAIVRKFAREGASVVFTYNKNKESAEKIVNDLAAENISVTCLPCSLQDSASVQAVVDKTIEKFDRVDILVNNAGIIRDGLFMTMEEDTWKDVINTNVGGTFLFSKGVCEHMMFQKKGRIINMSSVVSQIGSVGQANYVASKGAINALTRALAAEFASKGITVNAIAPGLVATEMIENVKGLAGDLTKRIPCGRFADPDEVAALIVFLASDEAGYITGQVITIDGGLSLNARR